VSTTCGAIRVTRADSRGEDLSIQKPRVTKPEIDTSASAKWLYFRNKYMLEIWFPGKSVRDVTYGFLHSFWQAGNRT
jgi:hypothetical protein